MSLHDNLRAGVAALGISLDQSQLDQLIDYLLLLQKWNLHYNLTAIRDLEQMVSHHLLDSLSILHCLPSAGDALDVGSGAGLPGLPLAIAMPQTNWTLLDSNAKKTRFIQQAIVHCGIKNARVVQARVQDYHAAQSPDFIISRAYASLANLCDTVAHLLQPETRLMTMKAELTTNERQQLDPTHFRIEEERLTVPGVDKQRSLVTIIPL